MRNRGFTLIELMIVVAVVAILAAIAIPSYQNQVQQTRRADAHTALLQSAQNLERCFTRTNTYEGCDVPTASPDGFYAISATQQTATAFTIQAVAVGRQERDTGCLTMSINHRGQKEPNPDPNRCWRI